MTFEASVACIGDAPRSASIPDCSKPCVVQTVRHRILTQRPRVKLP